MIKKRKNNKSSRDEPYLIAYILRGSTSSLLNYITSHPGGMDAARKDIIKIKYLFSKCHLVIQNLVRKMVTKFESFEIKQNDWCFDEEQIEYTIKDNDTGYWFFCEDINGNAEIKIAENGILSNNKIEHTMFVYAIKSVEYIKNNIVQIIKDQKTEQMKQQYIEVYK
ncbi:hypothetical protein [Yersinia phage fHe-Yen9-03]|uniref:Uncharacterized protein n=1 Tax=Yersinia phage fHe-Yen9-03 TaxID=2052743 RepID=A0A2C9CY41_9CAUD|nr:hypothetical protein [Yersinia phage fHe-Yen9-03]